MTISVTQDDINKAIEALFDTSNFVSRACVCPIAQAVNRTCSENGKEPNFDERAVIGVTRGQVGYCDNGNLVKFDLPPEAQTFVARFDNTNTSKEIEPFSFELPIDPFVFPNSDSPKDIPT